MSDAKPTPWQRARHLAKRQWTDDGIVAALIEDGVESERAEKIVRDGHASLERDRVRGCDEIGDRMWAVAFGEIVVDKPTFDALYVLGRAHRGYGEPADAAKIRETARKLAAAKRAKEGRRPHVVQGGKTG